MPPLNHNYIVLARMSLVVLGMCAVLIIAIFQNESVSSKFTFAQSARTGNTISGNVRLTKAVNAELDVVLASCDNLNCTYLQHRHLSFSPEVSSLTYNFENIGDIEYKIFVTSELKSSSEFVYIFFAPPYRTGGTYVISCDPNGLVKFENGKQVCILKSKGIADFMVCTDDFCHDPSNISRIQKESGGNLSDILRSIENGGSVGECNYSGPQTRCMLNTGVCSVCNLERYFVTGGGKTARQKAIEASQICQGESGGNPFALNRGCMIGGAREYSVGLFQINLLWAGRCPQERRAPQCSDGDPLLVACRNYYFEPGNNIAKMLEMSGNGVAWRPWTVARRCGLVY